MPSQSDVCGIVLLVVVISTSTSIASNGMFDHCTLSCSISVDARKNVMTVQMKTIVSRLIRVWGYAFISGP